VTWALAAPVESIRAIARLRQRAGVMVCSAGSEVWLRGEVPDQQLDEPLAQALRVIPGGRQFTVLAGDQLVAAGKLVPTGRLPAGPWRPLAEWLSLNLPPPNQPKA